MDNAVNNKNRKKKTENIEKKLMIQIIIMSVKAIMMIVRMMWAKMIIIIKIVIKDKMLDKNKIAKMIMESKVEIRNGKKNLIKSMTVKNIKTEGNKESQKK